MKSNKKNNRAAATPPLSVQELQSAMTPTRMIRKNSEMSAISNSSSVQQQTREMNANKQTDKKALAKLNMETVASNAEKARQRLLLNLLNPANSKSETNSNCVRATKTNQNVNNSNITNKNIISNNNNNNNNVLTVEEMGLLKPTVKRQKTLPSGAHIKRRPRSIAPRYNNKQQQQQLQQQQQQQQQQQRYISSPYNSELTRNSDSINKGSNDMNNLSNALIHLTSENSNVSRHDILGSSMESPMNVCFPLSSNKLNINSGNTMIKAHVNEKDSYGDDLRGVQHDTNMGYNSSSSLEIPSHLRESNALCRYNAPMLRPSLMTLYGSTSEMELKKVKQCGSGDNVNLVRSGGYGNELHKESAMSDKMEQTTSAANVNRATYSRCTSSLSEVKETTYHVPSAEAENYSKTRRRRQNSRNATKRNSNNNNGGRESAMSLYSTNNISNTTNNNSYSKVNSSTSGVKSSMYTPIMRYNSEYNEKLMSGMMTPFASINLTSSQRLLPISSKTRSSSSSNNNTNNNNVASHEMNNDDKNRIINVSGTNMSYCTSPGISLSASNVSVSSANVASATSPHSLEMCREVVLQRYEELCSALSEVPCEEWISVLCKKSNAHFSRQNSYNAQRVNSGREVMESKNKKVKSHVNNNNNRNMIGKVDSGRNSSGRRSGRNRNKLNNNKNNNNNEHFLHHHHHQHHKNNHNNPLEQEQLRSKTSCEQNLKSVNELATASETTAQVKVETEKVENKQGEVAKLNLEHEISNNSAKENSTSYSNSRITSPTIRGRKECSWNKRGVNVEMLYREGASSLMSRGATKLSFHDTLKYVSQYCEQYLQPYVNKMNVIMSQRHAVREAVEKFAHLYSEFRLFVLTMHEARIHEKMESSSDEHHEQQQQQQEEHGYTSKHVKLQHFADELTMRLQQIQFRVVELLLHMANVTKEIRKPLGTIELTEPREPVPELQTTKPLALLQTHLLLKEQRQQENEEIEEESKGGKHITSTITSTIPKSENENKEITTNSNNNNNTVMSSTSMLESLLSFNATHERVNSNTNNNNNNSISNANLASTSTMSSSTLMSSRGEGTAVTKGHPFQLPQYELHDVCNLDSAMSYMLNTLAAPAGYTRFVIAQEKEIAHELTSICNGIRALLTQTEKVAAMPTPCANEIAQKDNDSNTWEWHLIEIEDANILKTPIFTANTSLSSTINSNSKNNSNNVALMTMSQHITPPQLLPSRTKENARKNKDARKRTTSASASFRMIGNINNNSYSSGSNNSLSHKQSQQQQVHSLNSSKSSASADEKRHYVKTPRLCVPSTLSRMTLNTRSNNSNNTSNAEGNTNTSAINMTSDEILITETHHNNNNSNGAIPRPPLCPAMITQANNNSTNNNINNKKDKDSNFQHHNNTNNSVHLSIPVFVVNDISLWLQTSSSSQSNTTMHHQQQSSQWEPLRWCSVPLLKLIRKAMPYDKTESITSNESHAELNATHRTSSGMMTSLVNRGLPHQINSENMSRPRSRSASVSAGRQARQRSLSVAARYGQSRAEHAMSPYNKSIRSNSIININNDGASVNNNNTVRGVNEAEYKIVKLTRVELQEALNVWEAISSVMKFSPFSAKTSPTEKNTEESAIKTKDEASTAMPMEEVHLIPEKTKLSAVPLEEEVKKKNVADTNEEMPETQSTEEPSHSEENEKMAKKIQDKQKEENEIKEENKEDRNVGNNVITVKRAAHEQMEPQILLTSNDVTKDAEELVSQPLHELEEPCATDYKEKDHTESSNENNRSNDDDNNNNINSKMISDEIVSMDKYEEEKEHESEQYVIEEEEHIMLDNKQNNTDNEKIRVHAAEVIVRAWRVYHARVECARRKEIQIAQEQERALHARQTVQYACAKRFLVAAMHRHRYKQEMIKKMISPVASLATTTTVESISKTDVNFLLNESEIVLSTRERFLRAKQQRAKFASAPVPSQSQHKIQEQNKDEHTISQMQMNDFTSAENIAAQATVQSIKHPSLSSHSSLSLLEEIQKQPLPLAEKGISTNDIAHYNIDADSFEVTALHRLLHAPQPLLYLLRVLIDRYPTKPPMGYAPPKETEKAELSTSPARKSLEVMELQDANKDNRNDANIEISTSDDDDDDTDTDSESSSEETEDSQASPSVSKSCDKEEQQYELLQIAQEKQNQITSPKNVFASLCSSPNETRICFFTFAKLHLLASQERFKRPLNEITKLQEKVLIIKEEEEGEEETTTANKVATQMLYVPLASHPALYKSLVMKHEQNIPTPVIKPFARPFERWNNAHHVLRRIFCAGAIYAWKLIFSHTPHDDYKQRILQSDEERIARLQRVQQRNQMILACYNVHSERAWMREASSDLSFVAQLVSPKRAFDQNDPHFAKHCRETYEFVEDFIYQCFPTVSSLDDIPSFLIGAGVYFVLQESLHCEYNALHVHSVLNYLPEHVMEDEQLFMQIKNANESSKSESVNLNTRFQHYTIERYEMIRLMQMLCECCHRHSTSSKNEVSKENEQLHQEEEESKESDEEEQEEENEHVSDEHRQLHETETKCEANSSSEMSSEQRENSEGLSSSKQENATSGSLEHTTSSNNTNIENSTSNYAIKEVHVNTKSNAAGNDDDHCNLNKDFKYNEHAQRKSVSTSETIESNLEETHDQNEKRCVWNEEHALLVRVNTCNVNESHYKNNSFSRNSRSSTTNDSKNASITEFEKNVMRALVKSARKAAAAAAASQSVERKSSTSPDNASSLSQSKKENESTELCIVFPKHFIELLAQKLTLELFALNIELDVCVDAETVNDVRYEANSSHYI